MRLIKIVHHSMIAYYPAHQILYVKKVANLAFVRFQGDLTTYSTSPAGADKLLIWLMDKYSKPDFTLESSDISTAP